MRHLTRLGLPLVLSLAPLTALAEDDEDYQARIDEMLAGFEPLAQGGRPTVQSHQQAELGLVEPRIAQPDQHAGALLDRLYFGKKSRIVEVLVQRRSGLAVQRFELAHLFLSREPRWGGSTCCEEQQRCSE